MSQPTAEQLLEQAFMTALLEITIELEQATDRLIMQLARPALNDELASLVPLLHSSEGALRLLNRPKFAALLRLCGQLLRHWLQQQTPPAVEDLQLLNDALQCLHTVLSPEIIRAFDGAPPCESKLDAYGQALLKKLRPPAPTPQKSDQPKKADASGIDPMIRAIFIEEAEEEHQRLSELWPQVVENHEALQPPHECLPQLQEIRRAFHTLKGSGRMVQAQQIAELAWQMEQLLNLLLEDKRPLNSVFIQLTTQVIGLLPKMIRVFAEPDNVPLPSRYHELFAQAQLLLKGDEAATTQALQEFMARGMDALLQADEFIQQWQYQPDAATEPQIDQEILAIFIEEAFELHQELDNSLHLWRQEPDNQSHLDQCLRSLHTLKGGARLTSQSELGDLAHQFENEIIQVLQGSLTATDAFFQQSFKTNDKILRLIVQAAPAELAESAPTLDIAVEIPELQEPSAPSHSAQQEQLRVTAQLLDRLVNLAGESAIGRGRLQQQVQDSWGVLEEMDSTLERLQDQLLRLDTKTQAQVLFRQERQQLEDAEFDPLEMDRYSAMQQLARSLVESSSDLYDLKESLKRKSRELESVLIEQRRLNTAIQQGLSKARMVPFQQMVPRLRRTVRQVSEELGKQVELKISNASGELDRTLLDKIMAPLEHMLRNAVDHGLESPEERRILGKPANGTIELHIGREGSDILLTVEDDGQGINIKSIRNKAIELGLMDEHTPMEDHEVLQFIMRPGFSTAPAITQISGRGVGLDVVASEIKQLGGNIEIASQLHQGTRFSIRLPLTLSMNRALMIKVGEEQYAIPLSNIQGIVRVSAPQLEFLYAQNEHQRSFEHDQQDYPFYYFGTLLDGRAPPSLPSPKNSLPVPVLLTSGNTPYALQVDQLLGSRDIVVKALGSQFNQIPAVTGGTILGDGSVVIILDTSALIRQYLTADKSQPWQAPAPAYLPSNEQQKTILVVDDSVTVRKVSSRLLQRQGYRVETAKDGLEALDCMAFQPPNLVLLDIEMPRMDGFEVARRMRQNSQLQHIPIVMITSRSGEKHRQRARSLGVNEYLGKPFQEQQLLPIIERLLDA